MYKVVDTRNTLFEGSFQLLEMTSEYPNGKTIGIYSKQSHALAAFKAITENKK